MGICVNFEIKFVSAMFPQQNYPRVPYTFDRVMRIFFSAIAIIAVVLLLNELSDVLLPFLVACLIAYMLEPVVLWNKRLTRSKGRFIPVALTLFEVSLAVGLFCAIFIPYLLSETSGMIVMLREYADNQIDIPYISGSIHNFLRENLDVDEISKILSREEWIALIRKTISSSWTFLSSGFAFVLGILSWLIVILYVVFIMLDYEKIMYGFKRIVPARHHRIIFRVTGDIKTAMNHYFRGQFVIAFTVGILFSIGFLIIGLPMGVVLGLFIGMLNMVPYLQLISLPITAILCIVCSASTGIDFWVIFWESMAVYIIVQCIQDFFLTPKIMGKEMGLNPAIILLSLSIWGTLLGFMGLIIALPLTSLLLSYYDIYIARRQQKETCSLPSPEEERQTPD